MPWCNCSYTVFFGDGFPVLKGLSTLPYLFSLSRHLKSYHIESKVWSGAIRKWWHVSWREWWWAMMGSKPSKLLCNSVILSIVLEEHDAVIVSETYDHNQILPFNILYTLISFLGFDSQSFIILIHCIFRNDKYGSYLLFLAWGKASAKGELGAGNPQGFFRNFGWKIRRNIRPQNDQSLVVLCMNNPTSYQWLFLVPLKGGR